MSYPEDMARYADMLDAGMLGEHMCLSWCRGHTPQSVAEALGGSAADISLMTLPEAVDEAAPFALVDVRGDWALIAEPFGGRVGDPAMLRRLADGGRALSVSWNVEFDVRLVHLRGDQVQILVDPPSRGQVVVPDAADLPFGEGVVAMLASGLALGERLSGLRVNAEWLRLPHARIRLRGGVASTGSWLPERAQGHPMLAEPALAEIVENPTPSALPRIAAQAALTVAESTGLGDVRALLLAPLGDRERSEQQGRYEAMADRLLRDAAGESSEGVAPLGSASVELHNRARAALAVAAALGDDPQESALLAVIRAKQVRGLDTDARLRLLVLGECARYIQGRG
ncbi:hypothetical protein AB0K60_13040 [Thermopolyspora sp. NPDC052614]|uniref:hypothetical protein n=1 Tax=Thermopolyspora sp. NPDC052614 TaxID=3155682 RepID=UPI0034134417